MKKFFKKATASIAKFIVLFIPCMFFVATPVPGEPTVLYDGNLLIYDLSELTGDMLRNRNGALVIERMFGKCLDEEGNGKVLNPADPDYDYVSYRGVPDVRPGDLIETYLVYNPDTSYEDDVLDRFDLIVGHADDEDEARALTRRIMDEELADANSRSF